MHEIHIYIHIDIVPAMFKHESQIHININSSPIVCLPDIQDSPR